MSEFSKGKWELVGNEIHCSGLLIGYATNSFFKNSTNDREAKANALLISKAPELLKMVELLVDRLEENDLGNFNAVKRAKNLIKEATEL